MKRWAIVIGVDEYNSDSMRLYGAVADAVRFRDWVLGPGGVKPENLRLLLAPRADDRDAPETPQPTKDNVVSAIDDVVRGAEGTEPERRLYFYYSGHGLTARVANRDESALMLPGFSELHTDHSLAVRSLTEYFETTAFADQFIFVDACRNVPWENREFEIGRWPVPRRRDPGAPPVQQFILYATSPGQRAEEQGWPGEAEGTFTGALLAGLAGTEDAKAWSWERSGYEVRWERLASYVLRTMTARAGPEPRNSAVQVPQDTGARGVAGRDRDARLVTLTGRGFEPLELVVELAADGPLDAAEVSVLDALGTPAVQALGGGVTQTFRLPPKTYAVRAVAGALTGTSVRPVELYRDRPPVQVQLGPPGIVSADGEPASIALRSPDPLALGEIADDGGRVVAISASEVACEPGFYSVRHLGPEGAQEVRRLALAPGQREEVELSAPPIEPRVAALAEALGGGVEDAGLRPAAGAKPVSWPLPATVVAAATAAGAIDVRAAAGTTGVAVLAVERGSERPPALTAAIWPAGGAVEQATPLAELAPGVWGLVHAVAAEASERPRPTPAHWVALAPPGGAPTVVWVPVLPGSLALVVAQTEPECTQLFLHQLPLAEAGSPDAVVRVEYLERALVAGRVDFARPLAETVGADAAQDPFGALVAGYVLLRLGCHKEVGELAAAVAQAAPGLADAYVLRGEAEAGLGHPDAAAQAFVDAVNAGIPAFGEGLTRLVEGLRATVRATGFTHPRGAVVRHIFQCHARGSMWAAFTPRRPLTAELPAISASDLGFEA